MATKTDDSRGNKLPRGPHGIPPEEVVADQRRRLKAAMVELGGTAGYAATTVAHLIREAGVSRKTFYQLYPERKPLLIETFEECWRETFEEVKSASQRSGGRTRQIEAFTRRLCRAAHNRTGALGLCTYEIVAANPVGFNLREEMIGHYGALIQDLLSADGQPGLPAEVAAVLAGAIHREIDAHIRAGRSDELSEVAAGLARWARSYHPVPDGLLAERGEAPVFHLLEPDGVAGGRAPGTLSMAPEGYYTHLGPRSQGFQAHANRERILDAVAQIASEDGYDAVTAEAIIERADVPDRTFFNHFKNREEAFAAAFEIGHVKAQGVIDRVRSMAPDWPTGVRLAIQAFLEFLASEPHFTRMAFVRAPAAGPEMLRRVNEHAGAYGRLIFDRPPQRRRPAPLVPETIVHSLFEVAYRQAATHEIAKLTHWARPATYMGLAPFIGTAEAAQVAVG